MSFIHLFSIYESTLLKFWFLCSFGARPGTSSGRPGWPRTHRDPPAFTSQELGLKACATTAQLSIVFFKDLFNYYVYSVLPTCMSACQKRTLYLIIDGYEPPCGC